MSTKGILKLAMAYADESGDLQHIEHVLSLVDGYRVLHPDMYNTWNLIETDFRARREKLIPEKKSINKRDTIREKKHGGWDE